MTSEEDRKDAPNTQWSPSSTSTAPSHRARMSSYKQPINLDLTNDKVAEDVKAREASDMPLEGGLSISFPHSLIH